MFSGLLKGIVETKHGGLMIIKDAKDSSYPFTRGSTMLLSKTGIKLAPERVLGANLYPIMEKPGTLRMARLIKNRYELMIPIVTGDDEPVCDLFFVLNGDKSATNLPVALDGGYCTGYAIQNGRLCGCVFGDALLLDLLKVLPETKFNADAFVFSCAVCFPIILPKTPERRLLYQGNVVNAVKISEESGNALTVNDSDGALTVSLEPDDSVSTGSRLVKTIIIRTETVDSKASLSGDHVYIKTEKDCGIRVVSDQVGVTIGRFSEL